MEDRARGPAKEHPTEEPIDESSYGGSSAETGGNYNYEGPTAGNVEGDTMAEGEEEGGRPPEAPSPS